MRKGGEEVASEAKRSGTEKAWEKWGDVAREKKHKS